MDNNVVQGAFKPRRFWRSWQSVAAGGVVLLAVAGVVIFKHIQHDRDVTRANQATQRHLQSELAQAAFAQNGDDLIVQLANQLLAGVQSKKFSLSNLDLSQVYLDRGTAYNNQGKFEQALNDFQTAVGMDATVKIGALQGQLIAQSRQGNTAALVPILQQLVPLLQHSEMPLANQQAAQYQADIQAIQSGQEVSF